MQVCPGLGHLESLRKLLPDAQISGADDIGISGCTCDLHQVRPGDLFLALHAARMGYDSLAEAIARGCAGILSDRPFAGIEYSQFVWFPIPEKPLV